MEEKKEEFYLKDKALMQIATACWITVVVTEARKEFGRTRYTVEPIMGKGQMKVEKLIKTGQIKK